MRFTRRKRRGIKLSKIIRTKRDLIYVKKFVCFLIYRNMNISRSKLQNIRIGFGWGSDFDSECNARLIYNNKSAYIEVKRGMKAINVISEISHEIGHHVTLFGKFGISKNRKNIIGEISAYNFTTRVILILNKRCNVSARLVNGDFWKGIKTEFVHYISRILKFIPLGKLIKKEYRTNL